MNPSHLQWRDPGFPRGGGANSPGGGGANIRFCQNFPKTAWNWKNLDPQGGGARPKFYYVDPPLTCLAVSHTNHYTRMSSVLVWGYNWILFMHGWFCPICLIHLIGQKSLHFEKTRMLVSDNAENNYWWTVFNKCFYPDSVSGLSVISITVPIQNCEKKKLVWCYEAWNWWPFSPYYFSHWFIFVTNNKYPVSRSHCWIVWRFCFDEQWIMRQMLCFQSPKEQDLLKLQKGWTLDVRSWIAVKWKNRT